METIPISRFKATCLAVLERVRRTGEPILVTRRGQAVAEVVPPHALAPGVSWLGMMRGTGEVSGDLVAPATAEGEWEALGE